MQEVIEHCGIRITDVDAEWYKKFQETNNAGYVDDSNSGTLSGDSCPLHNDTQHNDTYHHGSLIFGQNEGYLPRAYGMCRFLPLGFLV